MLLTMLLDKSVKMQKKDNKEQEILRAAERLFAERGFKASTTTLIASEAGVTHAMLHYYFRTKEHIFIKVFDTYVKDILAQLKTVMKPGLRDEDKIRKVTELCFDFFNDNKGRMSLILEVTKDRPDIIESYASDIHDYLGSSFSAHRSRAEAAAEKGEIVRMNFHDLLLDIISVCSAPLLFEPVIDNILKLDDERKARFLAGRKAEAVELIGRRLKLNL